MNINLMPYAAFWGVLALIVASLIVYRKAVANREDDSMHLEGNVAGEQMVLAHKLEVIDRWGKLLTIVVVVYGIALTAVYLYQTWNNVPTY
jgi:heme/copper-type cytochrome/quinol oxidase subunit 2